MNLNDVTIKIKKGNCEFEVIGPVYWAERCAVKLVAVVSQNNFCNLPRMKMLQFLKEVDKGEAGF